MDTIQERIISKFELDVMLFNERYKMPMFLGASKEQTIKRLKQFKQIILDEVSEVDGLIEALEYGTKPKLELLAELADWLGDIQIYCASEMVKFKIPVQQTLDIIMASNRSKLGADGLPIVNPETGKVEKGPNYWKPEAHLAKMMEQVIKKEMKTTEAAG